MQYFQILNCCCSVGLACLRGVCLKIAHPAAREVLRAAMLTPILGDPDQDLS